jgi:hypothetical protein
MLQQLTAGFPKSPGLPLVTCFSVQDEVFGELDWSQLKWGIYFDDALINLDSFGTHDYVLPTMALNPSLIREDLMKFKAWDIVLINLQPGVYTIDGRVFAGEEEYRWVVTLEIEEQPLSEGACSRRCEKSGGIRLRSLHR